MGMRSRLLMVLAALLLIPAFQLPLWSIRIVAPQYNDGLGMFIGLRDIWGHQQHDIQNINILNHYIGMKPIVPAEVDVLQVMPYVVGILILAALFAALVNRRWLMGVWLALFLGLGSAGMYEFYSWNYDYGHNLSPDAPIKVPGMTYTPPLIGAKTLLTIRATSYPSWGTLMIGLAFAAGAAAFVMSGRRYTVAAGARQRRGSTHAAAAAVVVLVLAGCGQAVGDGRTPEIVQTPEFAPAGTLCAFCGGEIPTERFGGEITTRGGESYRFMSIECLAGFLNAGRVASGDIRSIQVVDYNDGERLIDAATAHYVRSEYRKSPSGLNLLASDSEKIAHNLHFFFGGERLTWSQVLELVSTEWTPGGGA
jgi:copper chaperone NosL